jgi:hypothetical protein
MDKIFAKGALLVVAVASAFGCQPAGPEPDPAAATEHAISSAGSTTCQMGYVYVDGGCMDESTFAFLFGVREPAIQPVVGGSLGGSIGGGEPPPPSKEQQLADAKRKASCLLREPACRTRLSTVDADAASTLEDLYVRGRIDANAPTAPADADGTVTFATTYGTGADATILLRPPYFQTATSSGQATFLLHEIGHATGRIPGDHGAFFKFDPTDSDMWNDTIKEECMTAAARQRCGL